MKHPFKRVIVLIVGAVLLGITPAQATDTAQAVPAGVSQESRVEPLLLGPDMAPSLGTFYMLSDFIDSSQPLPYPFNPFSGAPVYFLCEPEIYLVDDSFEHESAFAPVTAEQVIGNIQVLVERIRAGPPSSSEATSLSATGDSLEIGLDLEERGGGIENWTVPTNALYLSISAVSNGWAFMDIGNSISNSSYEVLSSEYLGLPLASWFSEGYVIGYEGTTPMMVPTSVRTNLFLCVRDVSLDSSGGGIPDYWLLEHFGTIDVDPWADPDGDCWSNFDEFIRGTHPLAWTTPPAPAGLVVRYNGYTGDVTVNWRSCSGPVTGYTVERLAWSGTTTFQLSAATTSLADWVTNMPSDPAYRGPTVLATCRVKANYGAADSEWAEAPLEHGLSPAWIPKITLVVGPGGTAWLAAKDLPGDVAAFRITRIDVLANDFYWDSSYDVSWDFACPASTNGFYQLAPEIMSVVMPDGYGFTYYQWWVQTIGTSNELSAGADLGWGFGYAAHDRYGPESKWLVPPFRDGREALKQNLKFLLRAPTVSYPLHYIVQGPDFYRAAVQNPTNYAYADICDATGDYLIDAGLAAFKPFQENYEYRNFVFNISDLNDWGGPSTGAEFYWPESGGPDPTMLLNLPITYEFHETGCSNIPALLDAQTSRWFYVRYEPLWEQIGFTDTGTELELDASARNLFGLPFLSANCVHVSGGNVTTNLLLAGQSTSDLGVPYMEMAQPQLRLLGYEFRQPGVDWLPGHTPFSTSSTNPILICSVGEPFSVAGYAKFAIDNAYTSVFGYLGQYFEQACTIDTNGLVTTNSAGMLSEYGGFFPTVPGPVALITMQDLDTGQRGTGVVHVLKLQVDANHDGVMDPTFGGPDDVSATKPFRFWVNNDWDVNYPKPGSDARGVVKDYDNDIIASQRDLEDFARLWICGMPALPTNEGYAVCLSISAQNGDPAINLFRSVEPDGGIGYLSDTNVAAAQAPELPILGGPRCRIGSIGPEQSFTLPEHYFTNRGDKYFLFEGAGVGSGELILTITQAKPEHTNVLARASLLLDLHDIKDFYHAGDIANNMTGAISNWTSVARTVRQALVSDLVDTRDVIVLVHGINVDGWHWANASETVFKRLYWAGYHGKFATVKWPCNLMTFWTVLQADTSVFNNSEVKAYKASTAFADYVVQLRSRFPGHRLHLLVHSQGNSVVSEAIRQTGLTFDTYILTQGALPNSAYDMDGPTDPILVGWESVPGFHTPEWQPMGYRGIYTNLTGKLVNFFNTNDPVLAWWVADQAFGKPDGLLRNQTQPSAFYDYDGVNGWHHDWIISSYLVTDPQESRAMISRSRTHPIGGSGPADEHGVIRSAVDLNREFGFDNNFPDDHSAQWAWPIQTARPYYLEVLDAIEP